MTRVLLLMALWAGCASSEVAVESATFGPLEFSIPTGWRARDVSQPDTATAIWTPDDNSDHQSVTLQRILSKQATSDAGPAVVGRLLDEAVRGLPRSAFGRAMRFRSKAGILGVSVDGTFRPPGQDHAYHRIHAVLFEGNSLVHLIFTSGTADASSEVFGIVLNSLRRKEG